MTLEDLLAEREIRQQLIRFARAMDAKDWATMYVIAAENIKADFGLGELQGRDDVIALIRSYLENCGTTQHILGNILVEVSGDHATSEAYVSDMHLGKGDDPDTTFRTLGNYSDSWKKIDGEWRLLQRIKDNRATVGSMGVFEQ